MSLLLSLLLATSVTFTDSIITLPTYVLDSAEKAPIFERDWSYQRAKRSVYPYALNDNMTRNREDVTYKALYLENEYIQLCILPEIGGRLLYAIDKTNGYDIFYHNHVVKPANVGMTGAWISGGVEWNVFHHHRQTSHIPCDYRETDNADGSKTIWIGETEYRHRMQWAIGVTLYPGKSYIQVDGKLMNGTHNDNSMLYWSNVSTRVDENYQICLPPSTEFVTFHCKNWFAHWPITHETFNGMDFYRNNIDASWWKNHYMSNSMFIYDQKADFVAGYDHGRHAGTMLTGNHHIIKGGKFWLWGPNSEWDTRILTDTSGHYIELMVGAYSDNQPDYNWSAPYETKQFTQYWYGIRDIGGAKAGNRQATLNMDSVGKNTYRLGACVTESIPSATLTLYEDNHVVWQQTASLSPSTPLLATVKAPLGRNYRLTLSAQGKEIITYQPITHDPNAPLPAIVDRPKKPQDIASTEECYLVGLRNLQFHNPFIDPTDYFLEVLRRDSMDIRANTQMGVWYRLRGEYDKAALHLRRAIARQTKDYTRPKDTEALYNLGLVLVAQGKKEAAMDTLYRATWTNTYNSGANMELAQLYAQAGDYAMALDRLDEALAYHARNYAAMAFRALLLSEMGQNNAAAAAWQQVLHSDPLHAMALHQTADTQTFRSFMREQPESYLELAIQYCHYGFPRYAIALLKDIDSRVAYPTVKLWLGHLLQDSTYMAQALQMPVGYCNPFRLETLTLLNELPDCARAHYYKGNLLYNLQPDNAIREWERCVEQDPANHLAWRNLGWSHWLHTKQYDKAVACYQQAISICPEPLYLEECDQAMEAAQAPVAARYQLLKQHHATGVKRYYPLAQEVVLGTFVGDYDYVLRLLDECYFPTREGVANFHDNFVDACIYAGNKCMKSGDIDAAIALYNKAFTYPENHQVFLVDERSTHDAQINYCLALAYQAKNQKKKAQTYFQKAAQQDYHLKGSKDYRYWSGLALQALGKNMDAQAVFDEMIRDGERAVVTEYINFYGAEGTTGATVESKNAAAYLTQALGYLGLGNKDEAIRLFRLVLKMDNDNLIASTLLNQLTTITLSSPDGAYMTVSSYGCRVISIVVPDRNGKMEDVVMGYDNLQDFETGSERFAGAMVGRYCNRILDGRFVLNGQTIQLSQNETINGRPLHIHGGDKGFDRQWWEAETYRQSDTAFVRFTRLSPHGEEGYPGNMNCAVTYSWSPDHTWTITYEATTDRPTIINMSQHTYFNLNGYNGLPVTEQYLQVYSNRYLPNTEWLVPVGHVAGVEGTIFDFTQPQKAAIAPSCCWVFGEHKDMLPVATFTDSVSGRTLTCSTTEPGLLVYTGRLLNDGIMQKNYTPMQPFGGLILETIHYPNTPNNLDFPSCVVTPEKPYWSQTSYHFE